jgi:hypothetical protein
MVFRSGDEFAKCTIHMNSVERATREVAPWIERLARLGYASKAIVYGIIGMLALGAAFGLSRATDQQGAFLAILRQPFGTVLLIIIALGLLGYAVWRIVQAVADPEGKGRGVKGAGYRAWLVSRGLFHGYLAIEALRFAMRQAGVGNDAEHWLARIMDKPFGKWLVVVGGLAVGGYGIGQIVAAFGAKLDKRLRLGGASSARRRWLLAISRYGLAARGVVFAIIGYFVVQAGLRQEASHARDIGEALRALAQGREGLWLLAIIALGLISYGGYELIKARYRHIAI